MNRCADCGSTNLSINTIDGVEYDWCENCGTEVEVIDATPSMKPSMNPPLDSYEAPSAEG